MKRFSHAINKLPHAGEPAEGGRLDARTVLMQSQSAVDIRGITRSEQDHSWPREVPAPVLRHDFDRAVEAQSSSAAESRGSALQLTLATPDGFGMATGATPRLALTQWMLCLTVVLAAHGLALFLLAQKPALNDEEAGSPIVIVELAPLPIAPAAPPSDLAPGPPQSESTAEDTPPPVEQPQSTPPLEQIPASEAQSSDSEPIEKPAAAPLEPPSEMSMPTALPSAPDIGVVAAGPDLGRVAEPSPAKVARWERSVVARIERFKHYPRQADGRYGVASIAFSIDRNGRLLSARIAKSSGSIVLDEEALAMIRRAAPLPAPPADVADDRLSFILPVHYAPTRQ